MINYNYMKPAGMIMTKLRALRENGGFINQIKNWPCMYIHILE